MIRYKKCIGNEIILETLIEQFKEIVELFSK